MSRNEETHKEYVARMDRISKSEAKSLDGLPIRRNCVAEAQQAYITRQYKGDPEKKKK